jgi:hypothetical protein
MKRLFVIAVLGAGTAMMAMPAQAETVNFQGSRAIECSITGYSSSVNFGNLDRTGVASPVTDNGIVFFCNQPFKASVKSDNGYLKLITGNSNNNSNSEADLTSQGNTLFNAGLNYSANFQDFGFTLNSTMATGGLAYNTPQLPAAYSSAFTVVYNTMPGSKPLLGGTYADTVTLTLTPQGV